MALYEELLKVNTILKKIRRFKCCRFEAISLFSYNSRTLEHPCIMNVFQCFVCTRAHEGSATIDREFLIFQSCFVLLYCTLFQFRLNIKEEDLSNSQDGV